MKPPYLEEKLISYVPQEVEIYSGTISQNVTLEESFKKIDKIN